MIRSEQNHSSQTPRFRTMRKLSRGPWLAGVALLALSVPASAQNIDTISQWNGTSFISSWGVTNTATYGQTFTPTASQTRLSGFTVEIGFASNPIASQAFVYQWDSVNNRIVGPALFSSGTINTAAGSGFTAITVNTGSVVLTPGQQYVVFLSTSNLQSGAPLSTSRWGALTNNTAIPNGQFVFQNNGATFANLSTNAWSSISEDLAITAFLSGGNTGEIHAQAQAGAFQLGTSYLTLLTDPFSTNRVGTTGPMGYAAEKKLPPAVAAANAMVTKAPPILYTPKWDVWGAVFGGTNNTKGEVLAVPGAATGDLYTRVGGVAAGADYRYGPDSLIGFSLAGGNINWSLNGAGVGNGSSDAFMAGVYGKYGFGAGYVSAAATYTNYWMRTDRSSGIGAVDQFHADFTAESVGGRLEAGYRAGQYWMINWTPYAAFTGQAFRTPNYAETAVVGLPGLALNVTGRTATAYRGEFGLRTDKVMAIDRGSQLNLFGKLAYAHDEVSDPTATVAFGGLAGGAPFIAFGTRPSRDLALTTAGAEWRLANGVSFMAKFDGEFGDRSQTYSGSGRIRYTW